jgi:hypothetical protein
MTARNEGSRERTSTCPIACALNEIGDRWSQPALDISSIELVYLNLSGDAPRALCRAARGVSWGRGGKTSLLPD